MHNFPYVFETHQHSHNVYYVILFSRVVVLHWGVSLIKINVKFHGRWQGFSNVASDWVTFVLPANQMPGLKTPLITIAFTMKLFFSNTDYLMKIFHPIMFWLISTWIGLKMYDAHQCNRQYLWHTLRNVHTMCSLADTLPVSATSPHYGPLLLR